MYFFDCLRWNFDLWGPPAASLGSALCFQHLFLTSTKESSWSQEDGKVIKTAWKAKFDFFLLEKWVVHYKLRECFRCFNNIYTILSVWTYYSLARKFTMIWLNLIRSRKCYYSKQNILERVIKHMSEWISAQCSRDSRHLKGLAEFIFFPTLLRMVVQPFFLNIFQTQYFLNISAQIVVLDKAQYSAANQNWHNLHIQSQRHS